jgi:probable O-glycosylation ligase (exosortase A-associated)
MRDVIVSMVLLGLLPACFRRPYVGVLVFSWLAYMRVQDLTWGFARDIRWSYYVAILMFVGFLTHPRERWFIVDLRTLLMLALVVLTGIGLALSHPDADVFTRYVEYIKVVAVALFTTAVVRTRDHLRVLVWVIALSLGFYGVKTGLWVILTGGGRILQGPGGMLADNNDFAMALAMAVPMLFQVGMTEQRKLVRRAFFVAVPLTILTVGATYSRGGFLSVAVAIGVLVWRSRNRVVGVVIGILVAIVAVIAMPQDYKERLATLRNPSEEGSAAGRLRAWKVATNMATANPYFGVGFAQFRGNWLRYCESPTPQEQAGRAIIVSHSSYFQIWAECGTPALLAYLTMIGWCFIGIWRVRRMAKRAYFSSWILEYCTLFEASLAAFVVGSTFLNRATFDLLYHWVAVIVVFELIARREIADPRATAGRKVGRALLRRVPVSGFGAAPRRQVERGFRTATLLPGEA